MAAPTSGYAVMSIMLALPEHKMSFGPSNAVRKRSLLQLSHACMPGVDFGRARTFRIQCCRVIGISDFHDHDQTIAGAIDLHIRYAVAALRSQHGGGCIPSLMRKLISLQDVRTIVEVHDPDYPASVWQHALFSEADSMRGFLPAARRSARSPRERRLASLHRVLRCCRPVDCRDTPSTSR